MENEIQTIKEIKKKIKDFEKSDIDKTKTKKLKFYEFNDFLNVSGKN